MNFLGIGLLELMVIALLGLIVVGPRDLVEFARQLGEFWAKIKRSSLWTSFQTSRRTINRAGRDLLGDQDVGLDNIRREFAKLDMKAMNGLGSPKPNLFSASAAPADKPVTDDTAAKAPSA